MKWVIFFSSFVFCVAIAGSAEYTVVSGDTIDTIAQKTGVFAEDLIVFNGISSSQHIIKAGDVLRYVSDDDIRLAYNWIEEYLGASFWDNIEIIQMEWFLRALDTGNIQYDVNAPRSSKSIFASDVLSLADAQEAK